MRLEEQVTAKAVRARKKAPRILGAGGYLLVLLASVPALLSAFSSPVRPGLTVLTSLFNSPPAMMQITLQWWQDNDGVGVVAGRRFPVAPS